MQNELNPNIVQYVNLKYDNKRGGYYTETGELFLTDEQLNLCRDGAAINRLCNTRLVEIQKGQSQT